MKLKQIEKELEDCTPSWGGEDMAVWAENYGKKLLAVAQLAVQVRKYCLDSELNNPLLHRLIDNFDATIRDLEVTND